MRRVLLYVGGWLTAVVIATAVGFAAVGLVSGDVGAPAGGIALVASPDATVQPSGPGADPSPTATPKAKGTTTTQSGSAGTVRSAAITQVTSAGSVTGRCVDRGPRLTTWSPKNGWSVLSVDRAGAHRSVLFGDGTTDVTVTLTCRSNTPLFDVVSTAPTPEPSETATPTPTPTDSVPGNANK